MEHAVFHVRQRWPQASRVAVRDVSDDLPSALVACRHEVGRLLAALGRFFGSARANRRLSQSRAGALRTERIAPGMDGNEVAAMGDGESVPPVSIQTPEGWRNGRRIEIKTRALAAERAPEPERNPT